MERSRDCLEVKETKITESNSNYRPEIDGLRAFAIMAVIINHFNSDWLPGGYHGVDIFFVISGYVITSSLYSRKSESLGLFLAGFYERRIRRLLPALLVCVVVTSILLCLFNPEPGVSLGVGWRALFGWSNVSLFNGSTDYFAEATELNPFTHTWSLGVEEQFYLLFPFLIWFTGFGRQSRRGARNLLRWIGALTLTSCLAFLWIYGINQPAAYFLMPFRFWEMASGCLVFVGLQNGARIKRLALRCPPVLLMVVISGLMVHPISDDAISTITIVVLTAVLMTSVRPGSTAYAGLTNRVVVRIGLISYSLYLWHWSILSISRWTIGIHWWTIPIQVSLMVLTAYASYRWIECPFRKQRSFRRGMVIAAGTTSMALGSAFTVAVGRAGIFSGVHRLDAATNDHAQAHSEVEVVGCNLYERPQDAVTISGSCRSERYADRPTIYAFGDSHMSQFRDAMDAAARENHLNLAMVTGNGCLFPSAVIRGNMRDCYKRQLDIERTLKKNVREGDIVFIGNALYARFYPEWSAEGAEFSDEDGNRIETRTAAKRFSERVQSLSMELNQRGARVVFYVDGVQFPALDRLPATLCREEWFRPAGVVSKACTQSLRAHVQQIEQDFSWRHRWKNGINRFTWDAYRYRRDCDKDQCRATSYHDSNHFNEDYASSVFAGFISDNPGLFSSRTKSGGERRPSPGSATSLRRD